MEIQRSISHTPLPVIIDRAQLFGTERLSLILLLRVQYIDGLAKWWIAPYSSSESRPNNKRGRELSGAELTDRRRRRPPAVAPVGPSSLNRPGRQMATCLVYIEAARPLRAWSWWKCAPMTLLLLVCPLNHRLFFCCLGRRVRLSPAWAITHEEKKGHSVVCNRTLFIYLYSKH